MLRVVLFSIPLAAKEKHQKFSYKIPRINKSILFTGFHNARENIEKGGQGTVTARITPYCLYHHLGCEITFHGVNRRLRSVLGVES